MCDIDILFAVIRMRICGKDENISITEQNLAAVYEGLAKHDMAHIAGQALSEMGLLGDDAASQKLKNAAKQAFFRHTKMDLERKRICTILEKEKIPFLPLKGAVLRQYYPEPWMRTSCDIDILVHPEDLERAVSLLMREGAYSNEGRGYHDVSLRSKSGVHLELHFDTIEEGTATAEARAVLQSIWESASPVTENSSQYVLSDEMFYFYHIAHMAKHFAAGGDGIRPFLDTWILNHRVDHNEAARRSILEKGGLQPFAEAVQQLAEVWFSREQGNELTKRMAHYILDNHSGKNKAAVEHAKTGGRFRYILTRRIFVPYVYMKVRYPVLQKHKWLLPLYQVVRWVQMLRKGGVGNAVTELKNNAAVNGEETHWVARLMKDVGL